MLTTDRNAGLFIARCLDVVHKARQRGDAADPEGDESAPIGAQFGRVAIHAVEIVHVRDGHITTSDDVVAVTEVLVVMRTTSTLGENELGHENGCHGTQENGVAAEESEELCGRCENFPLRTRG